MNAAELRNRVTMTKAETKRALGRLTGDPKAKTEAQVQREIVNALKLAGCEVYPVGQRDARKTQRPGVPDLIVFAKGRLAFVECKRPVGGRQSDAQLNFQTECDIAGVDYVLARGVSDVVHLLAS